MGIVFDFYRALRQKARLRNWMTGIADLLLCLLFTGMVFVLLLMTNWGEVRAYVFLGLILGLIIYFRYISITMNNFWQQWVAFLTGTIRFVVDLLLRLLKLLKRVVSFPLALISLVLFTLGEKLGLLFTKPKILVKRLLKKILFWRKKNPPA